MTPLEQVLFVIIFAVIWYGSMILIGLIFESRLVPLFKLQSRAYFPGDIALGVMILGLWKEYQDGAMLPEYWPALSIPITTGLCVFNVWLLEKDRAHYPKRAANSPTKLWHDVVGFFVLEIYIVNAALLLLVDVMIGNQKFSNMINPVMFAIGFAFYEICDIYDMTHPATPEAIKARHRADWKPLWKKAP